MVRNSVKINYIKVGTIKIAYYNNSSLTACLVVTCTRYNCTEYSFPLGALQIEISVPGQVRERQEDVCQDGKGSSGRPFANLPMELPEEC